MDILNIILLVFTGGFLLLLLVYSVYEKETRAALVSLALLPPATAFWIGITLLNSNPFFRNLNILLFIISGLFIIISAIKYFPRLREEPKENIEPFDERDHMFSRMGMQKFQKNKNRYYRENPEKEASDKRTASHPNLGEPGSKFYSQLYSTMANSAFAILDRTSGVRKGTSAQEKTGGSPEELTRAVRWMARYYGAVDVGITPIREYHKYSHHGRQPENWGEPVANTHKYGIVFVVKMDPDMLKQAPTLPVLLESSKQYVESAKIAHLIAEYIRELGYDAVSHVDGNYDIAAVPLAEDAGLGKTGRMGILVHRNLGPCVRLSMVSTDMPLIPTEGKDEHIEEFCNICKKCAVNCPTGSVPAGEKPFSRNFRHWSADQENCYALWRKVGTDCGFCIRVCPYTKKDTLIHRIVRAYISRNPVNQRIALIMDNIFYGRTFKLKGQASQEKFFGLPSEKKDSSVSPE